MTLCWHTLRPCGAEQTVGALLLIHGWLGSSRDWERVVSKMPPKYQIAAVDLPGHGDTPAWPTEQLTFSTICEALAAQIRSAFGATRPLLVGYSLGGRIALQLAQAEPELFSGVALIAAHPGLTSESLRSGRRAADAERAAEFAALPFETFIRRWYASPPFCSLTTKPDLQEAIIHDRLSAPPSAPSPLLTGLSLGTQPPPPQSLPLPALLIAGADDRAYCDTHAQFAGQVGAASVIVPDAGHALLFEATAAIASAVVDFIPAATENSANRLISAE